MRPDLLHHLIATVIFAIIGYSVLTQRQHLRRSARRSPQLYWGILVLCGLFVIGNSLCIILSNRHISLHQGSSYVSMVIEWSNIVALSLLILTLIYTRLVVEQSPRPRRVLAIGAHPDDIELACGATLAKLRDAGHQIQVLVLTGGEQGGDVMVRPAEARRGASFLGCNAIDIHNFADTRLQQQSNEILSVIEARVCTFDPDIIFTHSANDQHQDHQAVYEATLRAARNHSTILCYESPSATRAFSPTFFVDISDYVDVKIASVREHCDQLRKPYMTAERLRGIASFRGGQAKTRYAEGFEPVRSLASALGDL